jgi:hypothetical protein
MQASCGNMACWWQQHRSARVGAGIVWGGRDGVPSSAVGEYVWVGSRVIEHDCAGATWQQHGSHDAV